MWDLVIRCLWSVLLMHAVPLYSFDWLYYLKHNEVDLGPGVHPWFGSALNHYGSVGVHKRLRSTQQQIDNTNFDWHYYVKHNKLTGILSERSAYRHYQRIGSKKHLDYCKHFTIAILLHLYDLTQTDFFAQKIIKCMHNNPHNKYSIYINIPVTDRLLDHSLQHAENTASIMCTDAMLSSLKKLSPYHDGLITAANAPLLYAIKEHLETLFSPLCSSVNIIFSDNKGMDTGGFLLLLDALHRNAENIDFLIKLHTKSGGQTDVNRDMWRALLLSFLNIRINKLLTEYECIYSCSIDSKYDPCRNYGPYEDKKRRLSAYIGDIDFSKQYTFSAGTMFIVSRKFSDFMKKFDLIKLYEILEEGRIDNGYAHVFERLFGYFFETLHLKKLVLDYYPEDTPDMVLGKSYRPRVVI